MCQVLTFELLSKYNIEIINHYAFYIYNSDYFKNNISNLNSETLVQNKDWKDLIHWLIKGRPVQYCLGEAAFMDLILYVDERVLIPRPETEELVFQCIQENKNQTDYINVLDIGTGSGAIAIMLSQKFPHWNISALDRSAEALEVAKLNALKYKSKIDFLQLDFLSEWRSITSFFDIIITNPPYVAYSEKDKMESQVLDYEPHNALFASENEPDIFYKAIAEFAKSHLKPNGKVYCELNEFRSQQIQSIFKNNGFRNVSILKDLQNKERILIAQE